MDRDQKLLYLGPAFASGALLATFTSVRILHILGFATKTPLEVIADILLTAIVLMGGADQTAQVLRMLGAKGVKSAAAEPRPLVIDGKLVLESATPSSNVQTGRPEAPEHAAKAAGAGN